jgi:hypothetical protein
VEQEEREKRLALARLKEEAARTASDVARVERELLEIGDRKHGFARRDLAVLNVQDQAQASESSSTVADLSVVNSVADSGWSQANNPSDLSFDHYLEDLFSGDALLDPSLFSFPGVDDPPVTSGAS